MKVSLAEAERAAGPLREMYHVYVAQMLPLLDNDHNSGEPLDPDVLLDRYWENPPHWPYLILVDEKVAGFCLLRHLPGEGDTLDIDQFYVAREFRRHGVGASALAQLVDHHPGRWVIRVLKTNGGALSFWLHAVRYLVGSAYTRSDGDERMTFLRFEWPLRGFPDGPGHPNR